MGPWILSLWAGQSKAPICFANPFGDLFTPDSISPIEMFLCTVFLFFSGNFIFRKVSKVKNS